MKNNEIIRHINELGNFTKDKMPVKLSFAIVKNFNQLQESYKDYETSRKALAQEYSKKDEKGEIVRDQNGLEEIEEKNVGKWTKDITELLNIEVDLEIHKVDFSVIENLQLGISDISAIEFMISE